MDKLIKFCIERRSVTIAISVFVLILGLYSYYFMPRQEMPDTSSPAVQITALFPGASAKTVEEQVTKKIEDKVAMLDGVHYLSSVSYDNVSVVAAVLEFDVDYNKQWDKLRTLLDNLQKEMPEGVGTFDIDTDLVQTNDLILVFHSPEYDSVRLKAAAQNFKSKLEQIEGVKSIELFGEKQNRVSVELNLAKLNRMKLSITDIMNLIKAQNTVIPIGSIEGVSGKIGINIPNNLI